MSLIELHKDHDLAQVELSIQIVVKSASELLNWIGTCINTVSVAVIDEVSNAIEIVCLETLGKELLKIASINRRNFLSPILCKIAKQSVRRLSIFAKNSILKASCLNLHRRADFVLRHQIKNISEVSELIIGLFEGLIEKGMTAEYFQLIFIRLSICSIFA